MIITMTTTTASGPIICTTYHDEYEFLYYDDALKGLFCNEHHITLHIGRKREQRRINYFKRFTEVQMQQEMPQEQGISEE